MQLSDVETTVFNEIMALYQELGGKLLKVLPPSQGQQQAALNLETSSLWFEKAYVVNIARQREEEKLEAEAEAEPEQKEEETKKEA